MMYVTKFQLSECNTIYFSLEINGHHKMHPGHSTLIQEFRKQLLGLSKSPLTHTQLTEKTWYV